VAQFAQVYSIISKKCDKQPKYNIFCVSCRTNFNTIKMSEKSVVQSSFSSTGSEGDRLETYFTSCGLCAGKEEVANVAYSETMIKLNIEMNK
jgi:hypothetical protein